jgi:hypothetical protein
MSVKKLTKEDLKSLILKEIKSMVSENQHLDTGLPFPEEVNAMEASFVRLEARVNAIEKMLNEKLAKIEIRLMKLEG